MSVHKDKKRGTWYVQYRKHNGAATSKRGFERKSDAQKWEQLYKMKKTNNDNVIVKFDVALEHFLSEYKSTVSSSTFDGNVQIFRDHITPYFSEKNIYTIKAKDIRDWQTEMKKQGRAKGTYENWNAILQAFFNHCSFHYDVRGNPVKECGPFILPNQAPKEITFWEHEEFLRFYNAIDTSQPKEGKFKKRYEKHYTDEQKFKWKTVFLLFYQTGMRPGELCSLKWSSLQGQHILITRTLTKVDGKHVVGEYPKNRKNRSVKIAPSVVNQLLDYKEYCKQSFPNFDDDFYMFGTKDKFLSYTTLRSRLELYMPDDITQISLNDIRHSHASYLMHLGENIELISKRLGHSNSEITRKVYLHLYPKDEDKIADVLEEQLQKDFKM